MQGRIQQYNENIRRRLNQSNQSNRSSRSPRTYFDTALNFEFQSTPNFETSVYSVFNGRPGNDDHVINSELMETVKNRLHTFFYLMKTVIRSSEKQSFGNCEFTPIDNTLSGLLAHWKTLYGPTSINNATNINGEKNGEKNGENSNLILDKVESAPIINKPTTHIATTLMYSYINNCFTSMKINVRHLPEKCSEDEMFATLANIKLGNLFKSLNNPFVDKKSYNKMLSIFCKTQKLYNSFTKLAKIWKRQKMAIQVNYDLGLNPIAVATTPAITVYQNGAGYIFKIADLINIFHSALVHSPNFFADPLFPKNPYTNLPFSRATLYNTYYAIKLSDYNMPLLFHLFWKVDFDIRAFTLNNEAIIRDVFIQDFVKTSTTDILYLYVKQMIKKIDKRRHLCIHSKFPQDTLVDIMRPYLHLYLLNLFSISHSDLKFNSHIKLQCKFARFIRFNPKFGRKLLVPIKPWLMRHPKSLFAHLPNNPFTDPKTSPLFEQISQLRQEFHQLDQMKPISSINNIYYSSKQFLENPQNKRLRYKTIFNTKHMSYYSDEFIPTATSFEHLDDDNGRNSDIDSTDTD